MKKVLNGEGRINIVITHTQEKKPFNGHEILCIQKKNLYIYIYIFYIGKLHMHPIDFEPNLDVHPFLWEEEVPFVSLSAQNLQSIQARR